MADSGATGIDLILASASPRRRELLKQIGIKFEVISHLDVDETLKSSETPDQYVSRLAEEKARAGYAIVYNDSENCKIPVLGADTCIALDGEILGKPADREDGIAMLQRLSGRSHQVLTALCLYDGQLAHETLSRSTVSFKVIELHEIEQYWDTGEPADKAGAYAIQGAAARFVVDLHGSYSGVVGLPLYELSELLAEVSSSG
ncbi:MAG: Maf family protein [Arenicellales bacterium]